MQKSQLFKICLTLFAFMLLRGNSYAQINFPTQSSFRYLKGNKASSLTTDWFSPGFDDSGWSTGNAPFRYTDGTGGTELTDMNGAYSTVYLRSTFKVDQLALLDKVAVMVDFDDGFVLFINGKEVVQQLAPTVLSYNGLATGNHEMGSAVQYSFSPIELGLVQGVNTIAIYACNVSLAGSTDFFFDMSMNATTELPVLVDPIGITYSHQSGFYNSVFDLTLSTPVAGAKLVYTLDGSNPQTSSTAIVAGTSTTIPINPANKTALGIIPSVLVRASIIQDGNRVSKPLSRTFIYIDKVKTQSHPGGNWPTSNINSQEIDLAMDPDVVNSATYADLIDDALLDIPSISIITDNENLFNPTYGIYVNALEQGLAWEKECSVELLNPDGSAGFNVNAGLRIRGGYSRNDGFPKHAFRLFFREEYGASKLNYPLFEDEGVTEFDKIDLRCEQNYSWANSDGANNTFVKEVFSRDSQKAAGQPYTRSRYYHLYLNGMYWGLFQSQERSEANFAESYFGGEDDDYDVIKVIGFPEYELFATDGNMDKWQEIYNLTLQGFASNASYFHLMGRDANGKPKKNSEILVDVDNLIDYMINIFYSGNFDSPVSRFLSNLRPNNMYAIDNRNDKSQGFKFFVHDAEHAMFDVAENRVNIADASYGTKQMLVSEFKYFHTQWLHHKLSENSEYRLRFADRAWKQLNGNGIFTPAACLDRFNKRASQVDMAVIAESARWGDGQNESIAPYTKESWLTALDVVRNNYFPYRIDNLKRQLLSAKLYSTLTTPVVMSNGVEIPDSVEVMSGPMVVSINGQGSGSLYYTLSGADPRAVGGEPGKDAIEIKSGKTVSIPESAILKTRLFDGANWSAMNEIKFVMEQTDFSNFKITELNYHPTEGMYAGTDSVSGTDYEFMEFKNTGYTSAINLSGVSFTTGITYQFPQNTLLPPQSYIVIASKPSKYYDRYGIVAHGNFSGNLSNSGEQVVIVSKTGQVIMDFTYDDNLPWPDAADGDGYSLVSMAYDPAPTDNPNDYNYWTVSMYVNGSPGLSDDDIVTAINSDTWDGKVSSFQLYPNPTSNYFNIQPMDRNGGDFKIKLFDLKGTLLSEQTCSGDTTVSMRDLHANHGMYVLKIETNSTSESYKIVYTP